MDTKLEEGIKLVLTFHLNNSNIALGEKSITVYCPLPFCFYG